MFNKTFSFYLEYWRLTRAKISFSDILVRDEFPGVGVSAGPLYYPEHRLERTLTNPNYWVYVVDSKPSGDMISLAQIISKRYQRTVFLAWGFPPNEQWVSFRQESFSGKGEFKNPHDIHLDETIFERLHTAWGHLRPDESSPRRNSSEKQTAVTRGRLTTDESEKKIYLPCPILKSMSDLYHRREESEEERKRAALYRLLNTGSSLSRPN